MTEPSPSYRQHHDVEAPRIDERHNRPAWRILTRLDQLLADEAITPAQWHAAADFRELCELCLAAAYTRPSLAGAARSPHVVVDAAAGRLDALARLREISARLGPGPCWLLVAALVEDQSWAALGRRLKVDPKTARAWVVAAIAALPI